MFNFPLNFTFKLLALSPQVIVSDPNGQTVLYIKQKMLALKEEVKVFSNEQQKDLQYTIKANAIIDWSAQYNITDASGQKLGAVKRQGMKSLWKATYLILDAAGNQVGLIHEENGWTKLGDALFGEIPILGIFAGYMFHPAYFVEFQNQKVLYIQKKPAFLEGKFLVSQKAELDDSLLALLLPSVIMTLMLERARG